MVRRRCRMRLEALETRSLLSGLSYSVTTDQSTYQVGQSIQMTFTVTNTGDQPVTVPVVPTDFTVKEDQATLWESNPGNANQPPTDDLLQPGQSLTQTATWVPMSNGYWSYNGPGSSPYVVSNPNAPSGLTASVQIADPIHETLTTDQATYQVGAPVTMTFTATNDGSVAVLFGTGFAGFNVAYDGTEVWESDLPTPPPFPTLPIVVDPLVNINTPIPLSPGQSIGTRVTWDGIPNLVPPSILSGSFTVTNQDDPAGASATFQIAAPDFSGLETSVTTDKFLYTLGQPVHISFTETNIGQQPITVLVGAPFLITKVGVGAGDQSCPPISSSQELAWKLLQPGQSLTTTSSGISNGVVIVYPIGLLSPALDTYVASNSGDPDDHTAMFQVMAPLFYLPVPGNPAPPPSEGNPPSTTQGPVPSAVPPPSPSAGIGSGPIRPEATVPRIEATLSADRRAYRPGQPVRITLTIREDETDPIPAGNDTGILTPALRLDGIAVLDGSRAVWQSRPRALRRRLHNIQPGQTLTLSTVWKGRTNQAGASKLAPGRYTIEAGGELFSASTAITIEARDSKAHG